MKHLPLVAALFVAPLANAQSSSPAGSCPSTLYASCGNGVVDPLEQCDGGADCTSSCRLADRSGESHPRLLYNDRHADLLRNRLGSASLGDPNFGGDVSDAVRRTLLSEPHPNGIAYLEQTAQNGPTKELRFALLIYDLLHAQMDDATRARVRSGLLEQVDAVYQEAAAESQDWFQRRLVNNWTFSQQGAFALQAILYAGILFPSHPRSAEFVAKGLELLTWVFEAGPGNGIRQSDGDGFSVAPTEVDMFDETLTSVSAYGIFGLRSLLEIVRVVELNTDYAPFERFGCALYSEARYWTYLLSYLEGVNSRGFHGQTSFIGQTGHATFKPLTETGEAPDFLLVLGDGYDDPAIGWTFYANPSPLTEPVDYLATWDETPEAFTHWQQFLSWAQVEPTSPEDLDWPLSAFWPNAGAAVIRKQWEKAGTGSGVVWMAAGPGGSHGRPATGAVLYHADEVALLKTGPFKDAESNNLDDPLLYDPATNNTLFVDDAGQTCGCFGDPPPDRLRHGRTDSLDADTYRMVMSDDGESDFLSAYRNHPFGVDWTRKVYYDRDADVLWIKDAASTTDGAVHRFRFNWVADATIEAPDLYRLPGGYVMVARNLVEGSFLEADWVPRPAADPAFAYSTLYAGADGTESRVLWAVGRDEAAVRSYLSRNAGVFIRDLVLTPSGTEFEVTWKTDEPSQTFLELGPDGDQVARTVASGASGTDHRVRFTPAAGEAYVRVVALDAANDRSHSPALLVGSTHSEPALPESASISVYPNPTGARARIQFEAPTSGTLMLFDYMGRLVLRQRLAAGSGVDLDTSMLAAGLYHVRVMGLHGSRNASLVVAR